MKSRFYCPSFRSCHSRNYQLSGANLRDLLLAGFHPFLKSWGGASISPSFHPWQPFPSRGCKVNPFVYWEPVHMYIHPFHRLNWCEQSIKTETTSNTLQEKSAECNTSATKLNNPVCINILEIQNLYQRQQKLWYAMCFVTVWCRLKAV